MTLQKIREALEPFAKHAAEELDRFIPPAITADDATPIWGGPWHDTVITVGDFKRIRAALALLHDLEAALRQPRADEETVERVARAMADAFPFSWDDEILPLQEHMRDLARAAIKAMSP